MINNLLRVTLISLSLSAAIKFGAPLLEIPTNNTTATIGVFLPVILVALSLVWRQIRKKSADTI
jgi:membrane protein implicated in regulation of membrane protease activity